jgi:integrase
MPRELMRQDRRQDPHLHVRSRRKHRATHEWASAAKKERETNEGQHHEARIDLAYWFTTDAATGKRRQHSKGGFRTQKDAQSHLNDVLSKVERGEWKPDKKMTVKQLLENHWLPAKCSEGLRPATLALYQNATRAWVVPQLGGVDVLSLTPAVMGKMVESLRTEGSTRGRGGLSARSVQMAVTVVKAATSWAVKVGILNRDPFVGFKRPRAASKPMTSWSTSEARTFLAATKDDRLAFALALLLTRGLRRGELAGLKWVDVDLEAGVLRINRTRVVVDGKPADSLPKTAAGRRAVSLDPALVALLKAHRALQAAEKLKAGEAYEDAGWLVADELGRPLCPDTISERFDDLVKKHRLRRIRLHDTRHTAASLMLADGVPVKVVAELLGHNPKVTLATYAHVIPGMGERAGAALSAALLG